MSQLEEQLESIPGHGFLMDKYNEYAGEKFNNTNPFKDELGNKRVLASLYNTEKEKRVWKLIQKLAWVHDKCFLGSCGVGLDCGIGLVPLAVFFLPGLGAIVTYVIHARLISVAQEELCLPGKLVAKLQGNILLDLLISLPPLIGAFLAWLNGCLTRNAGMIYVYLARLGEKRASGQAPIYVGPGRENTLSVGECCGPESPGGIQAGSKTKTTSKTLMSVLGKMQSRGNANSVVVGTQQSGIR